VNHPAFYDGTSFDVYKSTSFRRCVRDKVSVGLAHILVNIEENNKMELSEKISVARCPECVTNIRFEQQPTLHDLVTCPECGTELEVIKLSPLKLDWAYDEEDDDWVDDEEWDGDEDYDDEDEE
jgi:alpha-aminoadipate/glutamate carrier protein LysW